MNKNTWLLSHIACVKCFLKNKVEKTRVEKKGMYHECCFYDFIVLSKIS